MKIINWLFKKSTPREDASHYSREEEWFSGFTHLLGLLGFCYGVYYLFQLPGTMQSSMHMAVYLLWGATIIALYLASICYHLCYDPELKKRLRLVDHICIYYIIAGHYTVFCVLHLPPTWGISMLVVTWILALLGTFYKIVYLGIYENFSTALYLFMGCLALIAIEPMYTVLPELAFWSLCAGGVSYIVGVYFFLQDHWKHNHGIWHIFVLGGSLAHWYAIVLSH